MKVGDTYSLKKILQLSKSDLDNAYFTVNDSRSKHALSSGHLEDLSYYKIQVKSFQRGSSKAAVVVISDHTSQVHFYQTKRRKELFQMVNACVSHEMKNPINSIQG